MKKNLSYILPIAALLVLAILAFRWLSNRPSNQGEITPAAQSAEGIEISDITGNEQTPMGVNDSESARLTTPPNVETPARGEIRYSPVEGDKTRFTVSANLPELTDSTEFYQLWIEGEKGRVKAMKLSMEKGGYMAEGNLSSEFEQVKVIVSKEKTDDDQIEEVQLEGTVNLKEEGAN